MAALTALATSLLELTSIANTSATSAFIQEDSDAVLLVLTMLATSQFDGDWMFAGLNTLDTSTVEEHTGNALTTEREVDDVQGEGHTVVISVTDLVKTNIGAGILGVVDLRTSDGEVSAIVGSIDPLTVAREVLTLAFIDVVGELEKHIVDNAAILATMEGWLTSDNPSERGPGSGEVDVVTANQGDELEVLVTESILVVLEDVGTEGRDVTIEAINQALEHVLTSLEVVLTNLTILLLSLEDSIRIENNSADIITVEIGMGKACAITLETRLTRNVLTESCYMARGLARRAR